MTAWNRSSTGDENDALESVAAASPLDLSDTDFYRTLVANTSEGLLTIDEDSTIVFANPALEDILGHRPDDLVGRSLVTLIPDRLTRDHVQAFQRYLDTGEPQMDWDGIELPALHKQGHEIPVSVSFREHTHDGRRLFTGIIRDVTDREQREAELERYEDIVTHLPEGIYRAEAEPEGSFLEANPALRDMLDMPSVDALLEKGPADFYADPDERQVLRERIGEEGLLIDEELKARTVTGETIWTSVTAIERDEHGETYIDGVIEDITERKERERKLREQQRSIETVLAHIPGVLFTLDDEGVFTRSEGQTLRKIGLEPGEAVGRSVFDLYADHPKILDNFQQALEGETVDSVVEVAERVFEVTYQPVFDERDDVEQVVGFAYDVTEQKEREHTLERQRTALERIQQIIENLRPLNRALARVSSRDEIERVVCEQLATSDVYLFAWYGDYNPVSDQITPGAGAGVEASYPDEDQVPVGESDTNEGPVDRAVRTREVQTARDILSDPAFEPWRKDALARGYQSAAAIPVVFGGSLYGVIVVYSGRPNAFDEYERGLLRDLGERIGHAIHAAENERLLHTDSVIELEFRTTGADSSVVHLTEDFDCRLELEMIMPAAENGFLCYTTVEGAAPDAVVESLSDSPAIEGARIIDSTGTTGTIEYRVSNAPVTTLLEYGATVTSNTIENGQARLLAEVAPDADTHKIIASIEESYPDTTFVAKRSVDRPARTITIPPDALDDVLTDRQREVLKLAYHAGFFESPRYSTGEELADTLGIASPTFYMHVRKATQKILEEIDRMGLFD